MPRLGEIIARRATVLVPFGGLEVRVVYNPAAITPRLQQALSDGRRAGDIGAAFLAPMSAILHGWDLTDDEGMEIPTDAAALESLPVALLLAIMTAIGEDMAPNRTSADGSSSISSPAASALSRNGTSS